MKDTGCSAPSIVNAGMRRCSAGSGSTWSRRILLPRTGGEIVTQDIEVSEMADQRIGILHPGEMGISIAASAKNSGCEVFWTSEGRSPATRERAEKFGLTEVKS